MLAAIELDGQAQLMAVEVEDETAVFGLDRMLAPELCAGEAPVAQQRPQKVFGVGLVLAQLASEGEEVGGQGEVGGVGWLGVVSLTLGPSPGRRGKTTALAPGPGGGEEGSSLAPGPGGGGEGSSLAPGPGGGGEGSSLAPGPGGGQEGSSLAPGSGGR